MICETHLCLLYSLTFSMHMISSTSMCCLYNTSNIIWTLESGALQYAGVVRARKKWHYKPILDENHQDIPPQYTSWIQISSVCLSFSRPNREPMISSAFLVYFDSCCFWSGAFPLRDMSNAQLARCAKKSTSPWWKYGGITKMLKLFLLATIIDTPHITYQNQNDSLAYL